MDSSSVLPESPATNFKIHPSISAFQVPYKTYVADNGTNVNVSANSIPYHLIAVGALTFDSQNRILLIQRAPTDSMPNRWETPGGACDDDDTSIIHSIARELSEEAGLQAKTIGPQVNNGYVFLTRSGNIVCKFNFQVEIDEGLERDERGWVRVKLDPREHQKHVWASEEEVRNEKVGDVSVPITTKDQKQVILDAFAMRKGQKEGEMTVEKEEGKAGNESES